MEEEKKVDETPEIFKEKNERKEFFENLEVVSDSQPIYLINIGRPTRLLINNQKNVKWLDSKGRIFRVETIMYRSYDDNSPAEKMKLAEDEKCFIYYDGKNQVQGRKIVKVGFSFDVLNYPQIIDFPIGTDKFDERRYTIKCGVYNTITGQEEIKPLPTEIGNKTDADILLNRFPFLEICDREGISLSDSEYRKNLGKRLKKVEGSIDWAGMEEVKDAPTKTDRSKAVNKTPLSKLDEDDED